MAYTLDDLLSPPDTGVMPDLGAPPEPKMQDPAPDLLQRLVQMEQVRQAVAAPTAPSGGQQATDALLAPYSNAIAGVPTTATTSGGANLMDAFNQIKAAQQGGYGGGGGAVGKFQFGNAFQPKQDLVTRAGVTLQRSALASLMQNPALGRRVLQAIGGGYRDLQAQAAAYAAYQNGTGNMAARPGHSYHNYGLAFDLAQHLGPRLTNYLQQIGWRNEVPGEWWHWSIGNAPWGGN